MTDRVKKTLKSSMLILLLAGSLGVGAFLWSQPVSSQAHSLGIHFDNKSFFAPQALEVFYQQRDMKPLWFRGQGGFQPRIEGVVSLLEESWTHGLNPEKYNVTKIRELTKMPQTEEVRHDLDLLVSDAVIRYARDLTGMRETKQFTADQQKFWRQPMQPDAILTHVSASSDPVRALRDLEPNGALYHALRAELISLVSSPKNNFEPIKLRGTIKPGKEHEAISSVRTHLGVAIPEKGANFYDDALASRVMTLQRDYGLKDDGVIDAETIAVLNKTADDKIAQIAANMERLRWLDQDRPDRYILVNIPSASLWAVNKGEVALEMPVIVGKTARPTYSFKTEISGVRFNPNWTVPPTIKKVDFLPMLQNDPNALAKRGIRMIHNGKTIDPASVDWSKVGGRGLSKISMVQNPGDDNPLGKVRVIMENPYNIYLHDTNHREMFDKRERLLSSGCIRVSQPEKLADFILQTNDGWTWNGMQTLIDSGRMRDVQLEQKIPVFITYQTIWLDSEGKLVYGRDVYGQDRKLYNILKNANGIHIPQAPEKAEISL